MSDFFGIEIPDAGAIFLGMVAVHIAAGVTAVVAGATVMLTRKGTRRHRRVGWTYLLALAVIFVTMVVMVAIRWPLNLHLLALGTLSVTAASLGVLNRRRKWADSWHIIAIGTSYIAMLTAFYGDNGPQLPIWSLLPGWAFWVLPTIVGAPIIWWAVHRRARRGLPRA
ncbi:hypothetical protein [Microbacterium sp. SS28]|uniref:hypothetical protein n=1 Tax=Microbacterium sp. SS28 TaxID=2919948 RepID=UPI001FAA31F9|nr:hypothetical protein [Microbacterium sp. SS28]